MQYLLAMCLCLLMTTMCMAQAKSDKGYFLYEPATFTPPTKDLIATFEGQPAEPFMANDASGVEQYLPNYKGQKVVLWFWDTQSPLALSQIPALNALHQQEGITVLSLARQSSDKIRILMETTTVDFPIVGNADVFGQMAYGASLGYPRFFLIDDAGMIRVVLPAEAFAGQEDIMTTMQGILDGF